MTKEQIRQILSMGYRVMDENTWGKPFGTTLFIIKKLDNVINITAYLKSVHDELCVWNINNYSTSEFSINDIKDFECSFCSHWFSPSNFEFLSMKEIAENDLM